MFCVSKTSYAVPTAVKLTHKEWRTTDNGVERVTVQDCRFLCDPEDFDLEVLQRSGENLKAVPTCLKAGGIVFNDPQNVENKNNDDKNEEVNNNV